MQILRDNRIFCRNYSSLGNGLALYVSKMHSLTYSSVLVADCEEWTRFIVVNEIFFISD